MRDSIEVFRAVGAAIILLVIIGVSIYYYQVEEERLQQEELQAKEEPGKPGRLVIIMPNEVHVNQEVCLSRTDAFLRLDPQTRRLRGGLSPQVYQGPF